MRTQIIRLERHDDFVSVRDKMNWGSAPRILLVWPKQGRILYRRLDLILLHRHSQIKGAQIGLISNDPEVRGNARILGIPWFPSVISAQQADWKQLSRDPLTSIINPRNKRRKIVRLTKVRQKTGW